MFSISLEGMHYFPRAMLAREAANRLFDKGMSSKVIATEDRLTGRVRLRTEYGDAFIEWQHRAMSMNDVSDLIKTQLMLH